MAEIWIRQRGSLFGWAPVVLSIGIGTYFTLPVEPSLPLYIILGGVIAVTLGLSRWLPYLARPLAVAVLLLCLGLAWAGIRAQSVAAPVLGFRYYGTIEGRIVVVDRSQSDAVRLTLDRVVLDRMNPDRRPDRVRVSLHGQQGFIDPVPGMRVMMTGHLSPPSGPVEPGGFDFQRMAWFDRLGAVGYTRTPVLAIAPPEGGAELWLYRLRMSISAGVQARLPGETGAFAAAILTGDRSGMGRGTLDDLRATNLAHLLAISGLHMGLLTGFVFGAVRLGLVLVPGLVLRRPVKKYAAIAGLLAGAFYLALSGGNVATMRAFVMVGVMFVAVLLDRRALTLRAVAIAALIVLALHPEELTGPGFQMSFAATTALVAVFGALRGRTDWLPRWLRPVFAVVVSSAVAGLATAPISAAHFNQVSHFGLIANLLSVPLMGVLVMPAAVLTACLSLIGLEGVGLWLMDLGLRWILGVSHRIADWDGALGHVPSPGGWVLPLIALGGLWLILWQGRGRWAGPLVMGCGFWIWSGVDRPDLLVTDTGGLMGLMTGEGRALSRPTGDGFAATAWLENDGAPVAQETAAARPGIEASGREWRVRLGEETILLVRGKTALEALVGCGGADLLITDQRDAGDRPCDTYDAARLRETGALAVQNTGSGLEIVTAREVVGDRLWNGGAEPFSLPWRP